MYRSSKNRKIPVILKNTGKFVTKHFVYYKLEKVNFLVIL